MMLGAMRLRVVMLRAVRLWLICVKALAISKLWFFMSMTRRMEDTIYSGGGLVTVGIIPRVVISGEAGQEVQA